MAKAVRAEHTETYITAADLSAKQHYAVQVNTAGKIVLAGTDATSIGTLTAGAGLDTAASVAVIGGNSIGIAGAAFNAGVELKADANGKYIAATTAADFVIAISKEAATAVDQLVEIKNVLYKK